MAEPAPLRRRSEGPAPASRSRAPASSTPMSHAPEAVEGVPAYAASSPALVCSSPEGADQLMSVPSSDEVAAAGMSTPEDAPYAPAEPSPEVSPAPPGRGEEASAPEEEVGAAPAEAPDADAAETGGAEGAEGATAPEGGAAAAGSAPAGGGSPGRPGRRGAARTRRRPGGEEEAVAPLAPIAHGGIEIDLPEPIATPAPQPPPRVPSPPMAGIPAVKAEKEEERRDAEAARAEADDEFEALARRVVRAAMDRATLEARAAGDVIAAQTAAQDREIRAARAADSTVEIDALSADAAITAAADSARARVGASYRRARRMVGGAKSGAIAVLNRSHRAAGASIETIVQTYTDAFLDEIDTFAQDCEDAAIEADDALSGFVRGIRGERVAFSGSGVGLAMIRNEARVHKGIPEATEAQGTIAGRATRLSGQFSEKRTADATAIPGSIRPSLTNAASSTRTSLRESINRAASGAYRALRRQRDSALEAIDAQERSAREGLRQQREVAGSTLEAQAQALSDQSRAEGAAAVASLQDAGRATRPHLQSALSELRGTLAAAALSPPDRLRGIATDSAAGVGRSLETADAAQRRQAEVIGGTATEGIATRGREAAATRDAYLAGARGRIAELPGATATGFETTIDSLDAGNEAAAASVARAGDTVPGTYAKMIGQEGDTGGGGEGAKSLHAFAKEAKDTNLPPYSEPIQAAASGFIDIAQPYFQPAQNQTIQSAITGAIERGTTRAIDAYNNVTGALSRLDATLVFDSSEKAAVVAALRGLSRGEARHVRDQARRDSFDLIGRLSRGLGSGNAESRAAFNYIYGNRVAGAAAELEAAEGIIDDDEARAEAALRMLTPEELAQIRDAPPGSPLARAREEARDYLGGTDLNVVNALLDGDYARADAYRFIEQVSESNRRSTATDSVGVVERYVGAPNPDQWGGQTDVNPDARRLAVARAVAEIRGERMGRPATGEVSDEDALAAMAEVATGTHRYTVRTRGGGTEERTWTRYRGANNDLLRDLVLHGPTSAEARSARLGVEIERRGRPPNLENLDKAMVDDRLNPNNYPPDFEVPARVRDEALADRDRTYLLAFERYGGAGVSTGDAEEAREHVREQLVARFGTDAVGAAVVRGLADEEFPSPKTASLAFQHAIDRDGTNEALIFRNAERMSAEELAEARADFRRRTGRDLYDELGIYDRGPGELSGEDRLRAERAFRGMARTDQEKAAAAIYALRQQLREVGAVGRARAADTQTARNVHAELARLEALTGGVTFDREGRATWHDVGEAFDGRGMFRGSPEDVAILRGRIAGAHSAAEAYKGLIDHYAAQASMAITALGIIAAVAVTIVTGGAASPLLMAAIAAGAGLAGMAAKRAIRGGGYGWEEATTDLALTALDALTAGVGQALSLASRGGMQAVRTAMAASLRDQLSGAVSRQLLSQAAQTGVSAGMGITGSIIRDKLLIGAITGGLGGLGRTALDEKTWEEGAGAGFGKLVLGTLQGAGVGVVSAGVSHKIDTARLPGMGRPLQELGASRGIVGQALGAGVSSGLSGAGGAFAGHGVQLLTDRAAGRYRGDAGAAFLEMLGEAAKGGSQGAFEGAGTHVRTVRDQAIVDRELAARRPSAAEPGEPAPRRPGAEAAEAEGLEARPPEAPGPAEIAAAGAEPPVPPRVRPEEPIPEGVSGTAAGIEGAAMRGDFADRPVVGYNDTERAVSRLSESGGALEGALRTVEDATGDARRSRRMIGGPDEPETPVRIVVSDDMAPEPDGLVPVARFDPDPETGGYVVTVSSRAHPDMVERALAHEFTEIRAIARDRAAAAGAPHPARDAARQLTPHERGRLAEFEVLARRIGEAAARGDDDRVAFLRDEAERLADHLGAAGTGPDAAARRALLEQAMAGGPGRALLGEAATGARDNPFLRPVEGTLEQQMAILAARLERAHAIDRGAARNLFGREGRAAFNRLVDQTMATAIRAGYVPDLVEVRGRGRGRKVVALPRGFDELVARVPQARDLLDALRRHYAGAEFTGITPGAPDVVARYEEGRGPRQRKSAQLDLDRPVTPHDLAGTGIHPSRDTVGKLLAERDAVVDAHRALDAAEAGATPNQRLAIEVERRALEQRLRRIAEVLGEIAGRQVAEGLPGNLKEIPLAGRGADLPDLVFEATSGPDAGKLVIIEAKGGDASLGARWDRTGTRRVQQGTPEYLDAIAHAMTNSPDAATRALGERIQKALRARPPDVTYMQVQQRMPGADGVLPPPETARFDLAPPGAGGTAAAVPGSRAFHGEAVDPRPLATVDAGAAAALGSLHHHGLGGGRAIAHIHTGRTPPLVTLDNGARVTIRATPADEIAAAARALGIDPEVEGVPVALFTEPDAQGVRHVLLSDRADPAVIERALAHELTEIAHLGDRTGAAGDMLAPRAPPPGRRADGEPRLSPHDRGRLAELAVIARDFEAAIRAPDGEALVRLQAEAEALFAHLGAHDDTIAGLERRAILYEAMAGSSEDAAVLLLPPRGGGEEPELLSLKTGRHAARAEELHDRIDEQARLAQLLALEAGGEGGESRRALLALTARVVPYGRERGPRPTTGGALDLLQRGKLIGLDGVARLMAEAMPALGRMLATAEAYGLPPRAALDLHDRVRRAAGLPPLSPSRKSFEIFLWDLVHAPRPAPGTPDRPQAGSEFEAMETYDEYSQSRTVSEMTDAERARHRDIAWQILQRQIQIDPARIPDPIAIRPDAQSPRFLDGEVHYAFVTVERADGSYRPEAIANRLFLRVEGPEAALLFRRFIAEVLVNPDYPGVLKTKMINPQDVHQRAETIVVYLGGEADLARLALWFRQAGGGALLAAAHDVTPMTHEVLPGVRTAQHPGQALLRALGLPAGANSFGDSRIRLIQRARRTMRQRGDHRFEALLAEVLRLFAVHGIDPDDPAFEMPGASSSGQAGP